jgi:hypothetical protein
MDGERPMPMGCPLLAPLPDRVFCKWAYFTVGEALFEPLGLDFFELLAELFLLPDSEDSAAMPESRLPTISGPAPLLVVVVVMRYVRVVFPLAHRRNEAAAAPCGAVIMYVLGEEHGEGVPEPPPPVPGLRRIIIAVGRFTTAGAVDSAARRIVLALRMGPPPDEMLPLADDTDTAGKMDVGAEISRRRRPLRVVIYITDMPLAAVALVGSTVIPNLHTLMLANDKMR